ncbi:hypothetical protein AB1484_30320 [Parafrankia sp. FMc6]|uniref:hypothetical protein n=1 Tax=Parafrankia soli TaxID=2599596 RepID=UPI0034D56366
MSDPVTRLDERFSDPDSRSTTWAAACAVLESAQLSWMRKVLAFGKGAFTHTRHVFAESR